MAQDFNTTLSHEVLLEIIHSIEQLKYGAVEITVHEGRVTQIERREKIRFIQETSRTKPTARAAAIS